MPVIESRINPRSEAFLANAQAMQVLIDDLQAKLAQVAQGGGDAARRKHQDRGKLLPRERIDALLDAGTPIP